MITISIEIHFTTLYMTDLGTRAKPLGEGPQAGKNKGKGRREAPHSLLTAHMSKQ
jgi:hypothetical protein